MLPFAVPVFLTLALVLLVGDRYPRTIAPGSGLKLAGLCVTIVTCFVVWRLAVRGIEDLRAHKFAALFSVVTGLMGWPVWSVGLLPSVNGAVLDTQRTVSMRLERTEVTSKSRSRDQYHWAWLSADTPDAPISAGRYFIPQNTYREWSRRRPQQVKVTVARGLLGAMVVTGYR